VKRGIAICVTALFAGCVSAQHAVAAGQYDCKLAAAHVDDFGALHDLEDALEPGSRNHKLVCFYTGAVLSQNQMQRPVVENCFPRLLSVLTRLAAMCRVEWR
jgi:hypothetical protein